MSQPLRVAVLASGGGSNLQALLERFNQRRGAPARVELVIASRPGAGALERAAHAGVAAAVLDVRELGAEVLAERLLALLAEHRVELVVLAGYLQLVPEVVVRSYAGRIINIHPALLPAFGGHGMYGIRVHRAVLASGATISGATVHWVDEEYDRGQILAQWPVPVLPQDTPEMLAARVLRVEHLLLPAVVEQIARGGVATPPLSEPLTFGLRAEAGPEPFEVRSLAARRLGAPMGEF
jgi:formyltetrahydrofolate-dependent phosphoribosylglycinamide formyltransferase